MTHRVRLRGAGRVELPAYGVADAEHQIEKEITHAWPDARVDVTEIGRAMHSGRIVEEFTVGYRVQGTLQVAATSATEARTLALRELRRRFAPTRFGRVTWEQVEVGE
ncbi:hypothetical protein BH20GEM3_BH20GEM3_05850 [soil metagenome]